MFIQIPVEIVFDCSLERRAAGSKTFTLRYDTDPSVSYCPIYCDHYPPRDNAHWHADGDGIFFTLLPSKADRAITERATADPQTYSVGEEQASARRSS